MDELRHVTLALPSHLAFRLLAAAAQEHVSAEVLAANLIARSLPPGRCGQPRPSDIESPTIDAVRAAVAPHLAQAIGWHDLQTRLGGHGFELRALQNDDLSLHACSSGDKVCDLSDLGSSHGLLIRRFGTAFPWINHDWVSHRVQNSPMTVSVSPAVSQADLFSDDDAVIVIDEA